MAGHSQFKNIMHRKGRQDAMRSKLFGKLAREITVAAKLGTPDPAMNPRLRAAVLAAAVAVPSRRRRGGLCLPRVPWDQGGYPVRPGSMGRTADAPGHWRPPG